MMRLWAGLLLAAWAATAVAAEPSGYVGASAGQAQLKAEFAADGYSASIDRNETAYKIFGGARFGILGLEGGYVDLGRPKVVINGTSVDVHPSGFDAFATLNLALGPAVIFAKGGALNWKADASVGGLSANESGTDAAYGAGGSLKLTDHLSARAEYEKFEAGKFNDLHLWSAGLELTF